MFHTPKVLKEIWLRFDFVYIANANMTLQAVHWSNSSNKIFSVSGTFYLNENISHSISFNGATVLRP